MFKKKAKEIKPSITLELANKAKELKSQGLEVIDLTVGEPDFDVPNYIVNGAFEGIKKGYNKYTNTSGIIELKKQIIEKYRTFNKIDYNDSNVLISTGAKQCLFNAIFALVEDGDEVIVPSPYWVSYTEMIKLSGGKPVIVETDASNNFKVLVEDLDNILTKKSKILILNNPNNPTGSVYTENELREIGKWALKNNIIIIADEIYERLTYGKNHISIASLNDKIKNITVTISGFSKTYAMTGWRLGYVVANENIIKVMSAIQSHTTACANSVAQYAGYIALKDEINHSDIQDMIVEFEKRRNLTIDLFSKNSQLKINQPNGAFYIFVNIEPIKQKTYKGILLDSSIKISQILLSEFNLAVVPGIAFGNDNYIRISYTESQNNIKLGLNRLFTFEKFISSL